MAMRGRPCGRRRLTRPAKLRKRIISPPRRGGKASVWRDRSAIPRAPRALSRFGNVDSFSRTLAVPARPEPVAGPRPNAALLFIVICAGGDAGRSAQSRAAQAKFAAGSSARIVISLLLTMPRCGSAAQGARCRSGQDAGQHPRPVRRCPLHDVKQPGPRTRGNASCLRAPRGTVGPRDRLRKTTSNANLLSIITLRSQ